MPTALTLDTAKEFLRYEADDASSDDVLTIALRAGQEWVEHYTGLLLTKREVTEPAAALCRRVVLLRGPVSTANPITVEYADTDGSDATVTDARFQATDENGRGYLTAALGASWPAIYDGTVATITYTAGYADADSVPGGLLHAMLVYAGAFDDMRNGEDMATAMAACHALIAPYRMPGL